MPSYHHQLQLDEVLVPGVLSIIGSCSVILTYILFSDLRRLRYVEFVFYVSVNCLIAAIGKQLHESRLHCLICAAS